MISVKSFNNKPMVMGELRELVLEGDGPFTVSPRCFIDKPKPPGPGFLPCPECSNQVVSVGQVATITASPDLWTGKEGVISIDITNLHGESIKLNIVVQSDTDSTPTIEASA